MSNILVTGSNGQLGSEIKALSPDFISYKFFFCNKDTLDITDKKAVEDFVKHNEITTIINCAAYTAVDLAEDQQNSADLINHKAVANLGKLANQYELKLVHISTDYVFNGTGHLPYNEEDTTTPLGVYGKTKYDGENALVKINPKNTLIIRTAWVYSSFGNNFVKTMLKLGKERNELGVIYDQIGSPTYAKDLAFTILNILPEITNTNLEIYHYSNEGVCSWFDFAKAIFEIKNIACTVNAIPSSAYPTKAKRPNFSVLNKQKIKETYAIQIPYWRDSLKECLAKL